MIVVSIVSYCSHHLVVPLIDTLLAQGAEDIRVVANDRDDFRQLQGRWPNVDVYDMGSNAGFGAGHQRIYDELEPNTWMVCLNPDVRLPEGWWSSLCGGLNNLDAMLIGIRIAGQSSHFVRPSGWEAAKWCMRSLGARVTPGDGPPYGVNGAAFAVRKVDSLVRLFDEDIFLFYEEYVLAERVYQAGGRCETLGTPAIVHDVAGSRVRGSKHARDAYIHAQGVYLRKYLRWNRMLIGLLACITRLRLLASGGP